MQILLNQDKLEKKVKKSDALIRSLQNDFFNEVIYDQVYRAKLHHNIFCISNVFDDKYKAFKGEPIELPEIKDRLFARSTIFDDEFWHTKRRIRIYREKKLV